MLRWCKHRARDIEREKIARLEEAEAEVADVRTRATKAIRALDDRRGRNHWRESIEKMIQGAS